MGKTIGVTFPVGFVCPHCGKEFKTESALKAHITKEHKE